MKKILFTISIFLFSIVIYSQSMKGIKIDNYPPEELPTGVFCLNCNGSDDAVSEMAHAMIKGYAGGSIGETTLGGESGEIFFKVDANNKIYYIAFSLQEQSSTYDFIDRANNYYGISLDYTNTYSYVLTYRKGNIIYKFERLNKKFIIEKLKTNPDNDF